jgi:hypothetical protein
MIMFHIRMLSSDAEERRAHDAFVDRLFSPKKQSKGSGAKKS